MAAPGIAGMVGLLQNHMVYGALRQIVAHREPGLPAARDSRVSHVVVHDAGPLTTVQDLGRAGQLRVGIPESGPVDRDAFVLANRLVGNPDGAAGLECTLLGPRLEFSDDRAVAVTGAHMPVTLNGAEAPAWCALLPWRFGRFLMSRRRGLLDSATFGSYFVIWFRM